MLESFPVPLLIVSYYTLRIFLFAFSDLQRAGESTSSIQVNRIRSENDSSALPRVSLLINTFGFGEKRRYESYTRRLHSFPDRYASKFLELTLGMNC